VLGNVHPNPKRSKWLDAYPFEPSGGRWLKSKGRLLLAIENDELPLSLTFVLENRNPRLEPVVVSMKAAGRDYTISLPHGAKRVFNIEAPSDKAELFIQNAGSFVTNAWDGGDVGTFLSDKGNFEEAREVSAVCGVSLFMRTALFEKLGGFDDAYFAYFEDTDLSLRARLSGYSCWYEPRSRLRHVHCGSGGEFSPYFNYNVTHSHILFTSRWMTARSFWRKFYWMSRWAWRELKVFAEDRNLETKPNLKTFIQCLRHPLRVPRNRLFRIRHFYAIKDLPRE
jgi:GT2 family glycosyltransferase